MTIFARFTPGILRACLLGLLLTPQLVTAQSISDLTLGDALAAALANDTSGDQPDSPPYQASSWLAGLPSASLTYLGSDERYGTDETEFSVNLPVKSGSRRAADKKLTALGGELDELDMRRRELYYSGLIREAVWSYSLADARRSAATDKRRLLLELETRQRELVSASVASEYTLLLLQMEQVEVEIAQQGYLQEMRLWLERYRQVTGLPSLPADIREPALANDSFRPAAHPRLRALELYHREHLQLLQAGSAEAADWNVALTAKNFDTDGYDERQYGLGVEIPLTPLQVSRQSENSAWRSAEREYLLARDQLLKEMDGSWEQLLIQRETLVQKQSLLQRSQKLAARIAEQLAQLRDSNEIAQEIVLRRMMDAIDTEAEVTINQVLIDQNNAMLLQAAGSSL
ncbi:MAG: hypothetical protein KDI14_02805 [Halioglobus sp.]|nr:hypothetical protein [Halioglobus sp.]